MLQGTGTFTRNAASCVRQSSGPVGLNAGKEGGEEAANSWRQCMGAAAAAHCADASAQCYPRVDVKSVQCDLGTKQSVCTQTSAWIQEKMKGSVIAKSRHGTAPGQGSPRQRRPVSHCMDPTLTSMDDHRCKPTEKKLHECNLCKKIFTRRSLLVVHLRVHTGDRPYHCDRCGSSFAQKPHLVAHRRIHTGERPYHCDRCSSSFAKKTTLEVHLCTHTGERPHRCDHCGSSFSQKRWLVGHLRTHTGERPYRCDYCGRAFAIRSTLMGHFRTHTGEKPFQCDLCPRAFTQNRILKHHKEKIHKRDCSVP